MKTLIHTTMIRLTAGAAMLAPGLSYAEHSELHKAVLHAAHAGEHRLAELLNNGASVDASNRKGKTALMKAADKGRTNAVLLLIKHGAHVNQQDDEGRTPLMYAADEGHTEVVRILLAAGADPQTRDKDGATALAMAEDEKHAATADVLRSASAASSAPVVALSGKAARRAVLHSAYSGETRLQQLLADGTPIDSTDKDGETALMVAAEKGQTDAVRLLLQHGAQIDLADKEGKTALMYAAEEGRTEVTKTLLDAGADPHAKDEDGHTALDIAEEENHTDTAALIRSAMD